MHLPKLSFPLAFVIVGFVLLRNGAAADPSAQPAAAVETDARLHADGKGWRVDKARVVDAKRPRVLLIGDSILNGYLNQTTKALEGKAYVDAWVNPYCQSTHTNKVLAEVLANGPYDVVHFNMGLHGWQPGRIQEGTFEPLTQAYVEVIREKLPRAKIIWASSTPVTVKGMPTELDAEINATIIDHNRMAAAVMKRLDVPVNDFYGLLVDKLQWARGDQFHWKPEAYQVLTDAAVASIVRELATAKPLTPGPSPARGKGSDLGSSQAKSPAVAPFRDGDVVLFVGDSITRGGLFHSNLFLYYMTRYPQMKLRFYNSGKSGDNAAGTLARLPWDGLQHKPNVAVVMLGMNDAVVGQPQDRPLANLEKLVVALKEAGCRVVQVGPTIYDETVDVPTKANIGKNAALQAYSAGVRAMAARLGNEFVDFYEPLQTYNLAHQQDDPKFTIVGADRVHPGAAGHYLMARAFLEAQGEKPADEATIRIDFLESRLVEQYQCRIESLALAAEEISFTRVSRHLPWVPELKTQEARRSMPPAYRERGEFFQIRDLPAGRYALLIDDREISVFTDRELNVGVHLGEKLPTPDYEQALRVAKLNERRHDIESVQLRGVAFVHGALRKAGIDPNDEAAATKFLQAYIEEHKSEQGNFGKTMYERYLQSWGRDEAKNVALLDELIVQIRAEVQPKPHRWKLVKR